MSKKKVYYFDIDGTITNETEGWDYKERTPRENIIKIINELYDSGKYHIVLWTSRRPCDKIVTEQWMKENGVKYHKIKFDKPFFDLYICDKVKNVNTWEMFI